MSPQLCLPGSWCRHPPTARAWQSPSYHARPGKHGFHPSSTCTGLPDGSVVNHLPAMQETQETPVRSRGWEDPLEEEMATHSSVLAWRSPWTEEPDRLESTGSRRAGHDWAHSTCTSFHSSKQQSRDSKPGSLTLALTLLTTPGKQFPLHRACTAPLPWSVPPLQSCVTNFTHPVHLWLSYSHPSPQEILLSSNELYHLKASLKYLLPMEGTVLKTTEGMMELEHNFSKLIHLETLKTE